MSRFVSGGTVDAPTERSEEWLKAQQAIEAKKVEKAAQGRQEEGKSLYETLQANKAAKQDAFEESTRLKNQFRALDEDEIDFLESLNESTRAKEHAVLKETKAQLTLFREQQRKTEREASQTQPQDPPVQQESWNVAKKRKRQKNIGLPGVKLRRESSGADSKNTLEEQTSNKKPKQEDHSITKTRLAGAADPIASPDQISPMSPERQTASKTADLGLGLAGYSSDDD
ncbi:hypothetical protein B9Z65_2798 [Elsinoe australis]|uniref:FAM192A/Fyv6 N-terminal domain-containing protein n=1 Tax=Elsinoe australis TaxID=40998 RepID=A0A2P8A4P5_9PEZI|nr:hypothetical protein B9Z65_2798 [Elsinoe australis]